MQLTKVDYTPDYIKCPIINGCFSEIVRVQSNGSILSIFQVGLDLLQDLFRAQIIGIDVEIGVPASVP